MNKIKVLFFATLRQRAGTKSMELEIPETMNVAGLREMLSRENPNLAEAMQAVVVAIDREFAFDDAVIPSGGEVAFFPPVSGG